MKQVCVWTVEVDARDGKRYVTVFREKVTGPRLGVPKAIPVTNYRTSREAVLYCMFSGSVNV